MPHSNPLERKQALEERQKTLQSLTSRRSHDDLANAASRSRAAAGTSTTRTSERLGRSMSPTRNMMMTPTSNKRSDLRTRSLSGERGTERRGRGGGRRPRRDSISSSSGASGGEENAGDGVMVRRPLSRENSMRRRRTRGDSMSSSGSSSSGGANARGGEPGDGVMVRRPLSRENSIRQGMSRRTSSGDRGSSSGGEISDGVMVRRPLSRENSMRRIKSEGRMHRTKDDSISSSGDCGSYSGGEISDGVMVRRPLSRENSIRQLRSEERTRRAMGDSISSSGDCGSSSGGDSAGKGEGGGVNVRRPSSRENSIRQLRLEGRTPMSKQLSERIRIPRSRSGEIQRGSNSITARSLPTRRSLSGEGAPRRRSLSSEKSMKRAEGARRRLSEHRNMFLEGIGSPQQRETAIMTTTTQARASPSGNQTENKAQVNSYPHNHLTNRNDDWDDGHGLTTGGHGAYHIVPLKGGSSGKDTHPPPPPLPLLLPLAVPASGSVDVVVAGADDGAGKAAYLPKAATIPATATTTSAALTEGFLWDEAGRSDYDRVRSSSKDAPISTFQWRDREETPTSNVNFIWDTGSNNNNGKEDIIKEEDTRSRSRNLSSFLASSVPVVHTASASSPFFGVGRGPAAETGEGHKTGSMSSHNTSFKPTLNRSLWWPWSSSTTKNPGSGGSRSGDLTFQDASPTEDFDEYISSLHYHHKFHDKYNPHHNRSRESTVDICRRWVVRLVLLTIVLVGCGGIAYTVHNYIIHEQNLNKNQNNDNGIMEDLSKHYPPRTSSGHWTPPNMEEDKTYQTSNGNHNNNQVEQTGSPTAEAIIAINLIPESDYDEYVQLDRFDAIRQRFIKVGVSTAAQLDTPATPQSLALEWIVNQDRAALEFSHDALIERYALAVFYFSTYGTNGSSDVPTINMVNTNAVWHNSQHWLSPQSVCEWYGIQCKKPDSATGALVEDIISLQLPSNNLQGGIPSEVAFLQDLDTLDLSQNSLNGTIPSDLFQASSLQLVRLTQNKLYGTIPHAVPKSSPLVELQLGDNQLTGTMPEEFMYMSQLSVLSLNKNNLVGKVPTTLGQLTHLKQLRLETNILTGPIPESWSSLTRLELLHMEQNLFVGSFPDFFSSLTNLKELLLSVNDFTGTFHSGLGKLTNMKMLILDTNHFEGTIPSEVGEMTNLEMLNLSDNRLVGTLPSNLGQLSNVNDMRLNGNALTGHFPSEIGQCVSLEHLNVHKNQMDGALPTELGHLINLQMLKAYENNFTGSMPNEICQLVAEEHLSLLSISCETVECDCCQNCNEPLY